MGDNDDILGDFVTGDGLEAFQPKSPEQQLFDYYCLTKPHPPIHNCRYWLKQELNIYKHFKEKGWHMSKPNKLTEPRSQLTMEELTRSYLEYYFLMYHHSRFYSERREERDKIVDLQKFLDMILTDHIIKKLMTDPNTLI